MSRDPRETLRIIEESALADEADRVLALRDDEVDRELREAGFDVDELNVAADELRRKLLAGAGAGKGAKEEDEPAKAGGEGAKVVRLRRRPGPVERWAGAAALAAASAGLFFAMNVDQALLVATRPPPEPPPVSREMLTAARLRDHGIALCDEQQFAECKKSLDAADKLDPSSERDPRVVRARDKLRPWLEEELQKYNAK